MQKPLFSPIVSRCPNLDRVAEGVVRDFSAAPCAVVSCAFFLDGAPHVEQGAFGHLFPEGPLAEPSTIFDLASITKPFTALTLARLVRSHLFPIDLPLGVFVREALSTPSAHVGLEYLLAHRSGLDGHRPLYEPLVHNRPLDRYEALATAAMARRATCDGLLPPNGFDPVYSDLGYLLLGEALSRAAALPLDELIEREVCRPLGIAASSAHFLRLRLPNFDMIVAPTELATWRGGIIRGAVHDENAWALGGHRICGHAGIFGTAQDVATLGLGLLYALDSRAPLWLSPDELEPLLRKRPGGTLRAGFDSKSDTGSSAGECCSSETFGHLGFTGTSLWIDPNARIVVCVLTNRVHPSRSHEAIKSARPWAHDALFTWAQSRAK
jgi:CubicO group peptidase (beta-lactamase class C family)